MLCFHSHPSHLSRQVFLWRNDLNCNLTFRVSPRLLNAPESSVVDRIAIFDTKLITGFDFATILSSSPSFHCCLPLRHKLGFVHGFDMAARKKDKLIMLNKRRRWFDSSRVELPLVNKSAFSFVSTYLIWIFGSELIQSNSQSSATLYSGFKQY